MSVRALYSAATGMDALQFKLDNTANNLANSGTTAFKRSRVNFEDLYYQHIRLPGQQDLLGQRTPTGTQIGLGTRVSDTQLDFSQGTPMDTGRQLDLCVLGEGFFQVQDGNQLLYTRAGNFFRNENGDIVMQTGDRGRQLNPNINIPQNAIDVSISADGFVNYRLIGDTSITQAGQIQLCRFINPEGLISVGQNLYGQTDASGQPQLGNPGDTGIGLGTILQGFLETSNTEPVRELIDLITTQRNFELNSQVVQSADQTLQIITNLRRF